MAPTIRIPSPRSVAGREYGDACDTRCDGQMKCARIVADKEGTTLEGGGRATRAELSGRIKTSAPCSNELVPGSPIFRTAKDDWPNIEFLEQRFDGSLKSVHRPAF